MRRDLDAIEAAEVDPRERTEIREHSRLDGPPALGVPFPGANAGSTKSTSNERRHGASPTHARTRSSNASGPSVVSSWYRKASKPSFPGSATSSFVVSVPRSPASSNTPDDEPLLRSALDPRFHGRASGRSTRPRGRDARRAGPEPGPVHSRERAELCEEHRLVAAKTQRDHPGVHRLLEPGPRALDGVLRGAGNSRNVSVIDERETRGDVDVEYWVVVAQQHRGASDCFRAEPRTRAEDLSPVARDSDPPRRRTGSGPSRAAGA